jgi:hypothetical protein
VIAEPDSKPKKRSRGWIGWTLIAALVLYPLSVGPVTRLVMLTNSDGEWLTTFYAPVFRAIERPEFSRPILWYLDLWGTLARPVPDPPPE